MKVVKAVIRERKYFLGQDVTERDDESEIVLLLSEPTSQVSYRSGPERQPKSLCHGVHRMLTVPLQKDMPEVSKGPYIRDEVLDLLCQREIAVFQSYREYVDRGFLESRRLQFLEKRPRHFIVRIGEKSDSHLYTSLLALLDIRTPVSDHGFANSSTDPLHNRSLD